MKKMEFAAYGSDGFNKYFNAVQERVQLRAAALTNPTLNEGHNMHLQVFEDTIYDYQKNYLSIFNIVPALEATGQPTMFIDQTKKPNNTQFSSPTTLTYKTRDEDYGRVAKSAMIKCVTSTYSYPFFNTITARQQGVLPDFVTKDIGDWAAEIASFQNNKFWYGTDTDLATPTTQEYVGLMTQIQTKVVIPKASTLTLTDIMETEVAKMDVNTKQNTGAGSDLFFAMNGMTMDKWIKEERARNTNIVNYTVQIVPGFEIPAIMTAKGLVGIVVDNELVIEDNTANGSDDHPIVLLNKRQIERRYIGQSTPMVFDMAINNQLTSDKIAVMFDNIILRNATYGHKLITRQFTK